MNDLVSAVLGLALVLAAVILAWRTTSALVGTLRRQLAGVQPENVLTNVVAGEPYNAEPHKCGKPLWSSPAVLPSNTIDYPAAGINA